MSDATLLERLRARVVEINRDNSESSLWYPHDEIKAYECLEQAAKYLNMTFDYCRQCRIYPTGVVKKCELHQAVEKLLEELGYDD